MEDLNREQLSGYVKTLRAANLSVLPETQRKAVNESLDRTLNTFDLVVKVRAAEADRLSYAPEYRPQHRFVRSLQADMRYIQLKIDKLKQAWTRNSQSAYPDKDEMFRLEAEIEEQKAAISDLQNRIPETWAATDKRYKKLEQAESQARRNYRTNVDKAYETIMVLREVIDTTGELEGLKPQLAVLEEAAINKPAKVAIEKIKKSEQALGKVTGTSAIKSKLSKARRALKGKSPKPEKAVEFLKEGLSLYVAEVDWRRKAAAEIAPALATYDQAIKDSIGLRLQRRLTPDQIKEVAACQSIHRDYSLQF